MAYADVDKLSRKLRYIFKTYGVSGVISEKVNKALNDSAADVVEVKHGEWIFVLETFNKRVFECSCCNYIRKLSHGEALPDLCEKCGAKMDGGKTE